MQIDLSEVFAGLCKINTISAHRIEIMNLETGF
jgi:hypothetical protein